MHIVHGTWIPDDSHEFIQHGAFYLWVETDTRQGPSRRNGIPIHPRHLTSANLATFLVEKLGVQEDFPGILVRTLQTKYVLLPTAAGKPSPSFELLRYMDEEEPIAFEMAPWQVCCYRVRDVIATLNTFYFLALHAAHDFQLGVDLLFWHQYALALKSIIARDQYIPALRYRAIPVPVGAGKRAKKDTSRFELYSTWELLSDTYEQMVPRYVAAMPGVCVAGLNSPEGATLLEKEALLRHFSECLLHDIVTGTSFLAKFDQQIAGTLLYGCIHPSQSSPQQVSSTPPTLEDYQHWLAWRANLSRTHTQVGFTLCLRLEEASASDIDNWHLHFLVAARHDPSLKLSLGEYWGLRPRDSVEATRHFGQDFEKNLLLALGYAAHIYPKIWDGLATNRLSVCTLTLEEAFAFLKESAWVLEEAGYTVIVPSWWTPEGRGRTKLRLKTSLRSPKKDTAVSGRSYLSFDRIIAYQYQLSIGNQVVSEKEWEQLVNAKTPLVQFRGEWMELDREKMQQLLEFWQTHQQDAPEISLTDLPKLGAEAGDGMEWDHDLTLRAMLSRLHDKSAFAPIEDPQALQGTLRDYQRRGVAWLQYLESLGLSPCLADDMGLGKTLQVIACPLKEREQGDNLQPTLIIAPTSVLGNWHREIERFAPQLRVLVHRGCARLKEKQAFAEASAQQDVVLTSFALARLDEKLLQSLQWHRIVVDEAQNIKNPQAAQTRAILKLEAPHRLALTGTPVENRLRDLWSIFHFLNPGYPGKEAQFRKAFELPIYKGNDLSRSMTLKKLVEPFIAGCGN